MRFYSLFSNVRSHFCSLQFISRGFVMRSHSSDWNVSQSNMINSREKWMIQSMSLWSHRDRISSTFPPHREQSCATVHFVRRSTTLCHLQSYNPQFIQRIMENCRNILQSNDINSGQKWILQNMTWCSDRESISSTYATSVRCHTFMETGHAQQCTLLEGLAIGIPYAFCHLQSFNPHLFILYSQ